MEITVHQLTQALKLIRSNNKDDFEKFINTQSKDDRKEILDRCEGQEVECKNINLNDYI